MTVAAMVEDNLADLEAEVAALRGKLKHETDELKLRTRRRIEDD